MKYFILFFLFLTNCNNTEIRQKCVEQSKIKILHACNFRYGICAVTLENGNIIQTSQANEVGASICVKWE